MKNKSDSPTSWQKSSQWYQKSVGEKGHYYHQSIIMPNCLRLLNFNGYPEAALLDLACGQGVLSRHIPFDVNYVGIDAAKSLIHSARQFNPPQHHEFIVADASKDLPIKKNNFTHSTVILALQNIEHPLNLFKNVHKHLISEGQFLLVLNHPCFRIPRQSSWQIDSNSKIQYRRIDSYMSSMKIPIQTHPGQGKNSPQTWSFHYPLASYSQWLKEAGFGILSIEEWCSDKVSEGKAAKMENKSRQEIPLFMAILAKKY